MVENGDSFDLVRLAVEFVLQELIEAEAGGLALRTHRDQNQRVQRTTGVCPLHQGQGSDLEDPQVQGRKLLPLHA